ncbi:MAG: hypothetical protein DRO94_01470 [Candidatus Altiarchaeales archaeon]|nr:MAG: hypothetical protein DRO95_01575 [Candidatus Altiarchaeales archaeon]RLI95027.1 MAG: hypothetical protein DRO94_01470 [Candidatus Altiarchaeales archaeon]
MVVWEVLNALKYHKYFPKQEIGKVGIILLSYGFEFFELSEELIERMVKLALDLDITIYDACYVALAEILGCKLITADRNLFNKVRGEKLIELL